MKRTTKYVLAVLLPVSLLVVAGCPWQTAPKLKPPELKAFTSAAELKQYFIDQQYGPYGGSLLSVLFGGLFGCAAPSMQGLDSNGSKTSADFSGTNLQETGVDESDVVKTDGTNLYILARQKLDIIQATPAADMKVAGHLDLDLPGEELYLNNSRAIVLAHPTYYYYAAAAGDSTGTTENPWLPGQDTFDVYMVDVSDPAAPTQVKKYSFQGSLVTSRMVGTKLYLVSYTWPTAADPAAAAVEDLLPKYRTMENGQETVQPLVGWETVYHPVNPDGYSVVSVTTLDTANLDTAPTSTAVMANYGVIYASTSALYVTSGNYISGFEREATEVHKFDLTGDAATYVASGSVPGWLLNQFSLGEKDGFLRVASTETHWLQSLWLMGIPGAIFNGSAAASENHVVVLEQVDNKLQVAGQIDDIAKGEQLYAARFVGDRGFLVTFRMVDPLFTVDLSDPHNPKIAGELKVPGFSEYIHMLDENHLLTIGKDALPDGNMAWFQGLKLSIFDITDMTNPTLLHDKAIGIRGTDSEALHKHKAFTYYNGMLAFPIDLYEGEATPPYYGEYTFGGLMVYRVSLDNGFEEVGRIATVSQSEPWGWSYNEWTRGIFIGDSVYAACERSVKAAAVADMTKLESSVDLP